jgi:hypothetical protein
VEPDRFDDVDFSILEAPEPAPRRRRRGLAVAAGLVAAAGLAAGATALASQGDSTPPPAAAPTISISHGHRGGLCLREGGRHHSRQSHRDSSVRY